MALPRTDRTYSPYRAIRYSLKSAYGTTAFLATHSTTELRELQASGRTGMTVPRAVLVRFGARRDYVKCAIGERRLSSGAR